MPNPGLSDDDRALLEFAARAPRHAGAREDAIAKELGLSPTRYYQRLNRLIDAPAARAEFPVLLGRLARVRDRGV